MHAISRAGALIRAALHSLGVQLSAHPAFARVAVASLSLSFIFVATQLGMSHASPPAVTAPAKSILPVNLGVGIRSTEPVTIQFDHPMDRSAVEASLAVRPATDTTVVWSVDDTLLLIAPQDRWRTDARYVLTVPDASGSSGGPGTDAPLRFSFTTQTAPRVSAFRLTFPSDIDAQRQRAMPGSNRADSRALVNAPALDVLGEVSTGTSVTMAFSAVMDRADTEAHFVISPAVDGTLSWSGNALVFAPTERLPTDARYAVTVAGAHDEDGNRLGGDASFSFTTRPGAQVVRITPKQGAADVEQRSLAIWFSQPMDPGATDAAFAVTDLTAGTTLPGVTVWSQENTQLQFTPTTWLPRGHKIEVAIGDGGQDVDHNPVTFSATFSTKAAPRPASVRSPVTGPQPPADIAAYALWQINQSRAAYGLPALSLDASVSAVASAHALDMIKNGYFSHTGLDGSKVSDRLRRAGVSFSWSGENMCYYNGIPLKSMLNWCHSVFMSEPYPGVANHIGNILGTHYTRVGVGIASSGTRIIVVWDFAG